MILQELIDILSMLQKSESEGASYRKDRIKKVIIEYSDDINIEIKDRKLE